MLKTDRIIALDVGASKIVLAEFQVVKAGPPELLSYGVTALGVTPDSDSDTSAYVVTAIRDLMRENSIRPAPLLMTISGQTVFPRYVKLPPVTRDKVDQIIQYEAEQNVPFPIEEVVWDYQLIGDFDTGEQSVMLVAAKIENVKSLTDCVQATGLEPEVVDVAPMALYNVVRFNYPDLQGCTMVLDIGARCSNLIFIEEDRIFSRSIPVAGNAITQELMKEFDVSFEEAEELKQENAFVAFGGVYAGPDNETADRISKIVRNVVTRLHAEVNRSINFYRSQQGGSPPALVLLTGGSSIIPHTDTFFREKLNVEVEYVNPFAGVPVSENIDAEIIETELHLLSEVTGLALRYSLTCPIEINLMPPELVAKKQLRRRQPFFIMSAVGLALVMLCWWVYTYSMTRLYDRKIRTVNEKVKDLEGWQDKLNRQKGLKTTARKNLDIVTDVVDLRTRWIHIMRSIHVSLHDGMWLTAVKPLETKEESGNVSVAAVEIRGMAFWDVLSEIEKQEKAAGRDRTALMVFRDRLREVSLFTATTEITEMPESSEDFLRRFTIKIELVDPIDRPPAKRSGSVPKGGRG